MARVLVEGLGLLAGGYLLLVGGLAVAQRDMIYHPGPETLHPAEAGVPEMVPVPLRAEDGTPIGGWFAPPPHPKAPTVVFFHGNARTVSARAHKARALIDAGYGVFMAEYRGYGGNPGRPSEQGFHADGRGVLDWLRLRGITAETLVLYGESLGTGVAVRMAAERGAAALVLEAPFTRLPDLAPPFLLPGLAELMMLDRFDNLGAIGGLAMPVLVLHGERDQVVPVALGRAVLKAAEASSHREGFFVPEAGHNDLWDHQAGAKVVAFIKAMVG